MADETTFFQGGDIAVTNARFIVGAQTFAMRGITSVEGIEQSPSYTGPIILALIGFVMAISLFSGEIGLGIFGLLVLAGGVLIAIRRKPTFAVILKTAGGEVTAYQSQSRDQIAGIIHALNQAIISHG